MKVAAAQRQGLRAIDNAFIMLPFAQARTLLFGDRPEATAVLAQLRDPERANLVKARIQSLFEAKGLDLNAYHLFEVDPTFTSVFGMFAFIFAAVSAVLALVIVFTIVNTISMTIVERVKEIGTIRALGFRQGFVRRLFLAESALTGAFGAGLALISGTVLSELINTMRLQWTPPSNATALVIQLMVFKDPVLPLSIVIFLVLIAVLASILPTFRASRLSIVESLQRH